MNLPTIITLLLLAGFFSSAQSITISDLTIDNEGEVSFAYSVSQHHSARENYQLQIFSSADNFNSPIPLKLAPVPVGETKRVSFDGPQLIGNHTGDLRFKFKIEATAFPVQITTTAKKFKSGKNITITWDDFHESGWYDVELYNGGLISKTLVKSHRGTSYFADLPKKMKKGIYEIRVTPSKEKALFSEDYSVMITSGGTGIFILGGALVAGAGVLLSGTIVEPPEPEELPAPPNPGN